MTGLQRGSPQRVFSSAEPDSLEVAAMLLREVQPIRDRLRVLEQRQIDLRGEMLSAVRDVRMTATAFAGACRQLEAVIETVPALDS